MGNTIVTRSDLAGIVTPERTDTWVPLGHTFLLDMMQRAIEPALTIVGERYELDKEGARMFAVWDVANGVQHADTRLSIGIRNAHDKAFSAGIALGNTVLVCTNLQFGGQYTIGRKHTPKILWDLPRLIAEIVGKIPVFQRTQDMRVEAYKRTLLDDPTVHDILIRSVDAGVMSNSYISKVLAQWRGSEHEDFAPRTVWSLANGYTEVFKDTNVFDLANRTTRLNALLDAVSVERGNDPENIELVPTVEGVPLDASDEDNGASEFTMLATGPVEAVEEAYLRVVGYMQGFSPA